MQEKTRGKLLVTGSVSDTEDLFGCVGARKESRLFWMRVKQIGPVVINPSYFLISLDDVKSKYSVVFSAVEGIY